MSTTPSQNKPLVLFFAITSILLSFPLSAQSPLTLKECYQQALANSERVAISEAEIRQARAQYSQALSRALPQLSLAATELLQDQTSTSSDSGVSTTFTRFSRPEVAIVFNQPLFQGLSDLYAIKGSGLNQSRQAARLKDAKRLLFADVARTFHSIAKLEKDIDASKEIISVYTHEMGELRKRVDLGKSRQSESAQAEAELAILEAELTRQLRDLQVAYEAMSFLTGLDPQPPLAYHDLVQLPVSTLDDYLAKVSSRPDVQADELAAELAKLNVTVEKGDLFPKVNAQFRYYPYRVGFYEDIQWDALFSLNLPIFNWGTIGDIREANALSQIARLRSQESKEIAITQIKKAYAAYQASLTEAKAYRNAAQKAKASVALQSTDFRNGLIPYSDVLESERRFLATLRARNDADLAEFLEWTTLHIVSGDLP